MTTKRQAAECLHVDDALNEGATIFLVRTIDTDVVIILVGIFHDLAQHRPGIWFHPGSHAQHSMCAVDFERVKNKLIVAACDELISNGGVTQLFY